MQQILILSLISFLFVSCGGSKNTDDWKAPNIYYLRADGNKSVVLTSREDLLLNDYIYISDSKEQSPDIEILKKQSKDLTISSNVKCVTDGKYFTSSNSYNKSYVQLKEILPIDSLLYPGQTVSCKIQIQAENSSGSTKTYILPERAINADSFAQDVSIPEIVSGSEMNSVQVPDLKSGEKISLTCDSFNESVINPGVKSITLEQFSSQIKKIVVDIPIQNYKPNQNCRVSIMNSNTKSLSNLFKIQFEKLKPEYKINRNANRDGHTLYPYSILLKNPHEVAISIAFNKASLKKVVLVESRHVGHDHDHDISKFIRGNLGIKFSNPNIVFDRGEVFVIHLAPGESIKMTSRYNAGKCSNMYCVSMSKKYPAPSPIFNLEYNYRTIEEILSTSNVKITERL